MPKKPRKPSEVIKSSLMSRNARSNENGRFDDISSNRLNVDGFDDFSEYWSNSSKQNQLGGFDDFDAFSPFSLRLAFWTYPKAYR